MDKKKSVYLEYSEKQVQKMEERFFVIQFGGDFVSQDDCFLFTKREAEIVFINTLNDMIGIIRDGNEKDRRYALDLILGMSIKPLRIH